MMRRVVVTGMGICCPLGTGVANVWKKLLDGRSGITRLPSKGQFEGIPSQVVGRVPQGTERGYFNERDWVTPSERRSMALGSVYSLCAATEALGDAKWKADSEEKAIRSGVSIGSGAEVNEVLDTITKALSSHKRWSRRLSPYFVPQTLTNLPAGHVSIRFGLQGPNHSAFTACATGAHSIGDAFFMITHGAADVMVAGGTEACVNPLVFAGMTSMRALSTNFNNDPERASRPFDARRDGFVLSEGAGIVVLEELNHAKQRGAEIHAEILGYGMSGEAYHITSPTKNGRGVQLCMQATLRDAGVCETDVGYVNAHATSTRLGDAAESRAIKCVFGSHSDSVLVSSTKGSTGHLQAAAGAVETIFTILSVRDGVIPPNLNLEQTDIKLGLKYVSGDASEWVPGHGKRRIAITNSSGFGGTNASLCIGAL